MSAMPNNLKPFVLAMLAWAITAAVGQSDFGYYVESHVARRIEFKLRQFFGLEPQLDPKVVLLSYDNATLEKVRSDDLELDLWGKIISGIAQRQPRMILIDKGFVIPRGLEQAEAFTKLISGLSVPIVIGGYVQEQGGLSRNRVDVEQPGFDLIKMTKPEAAKTLTPDDLPWLPLTPGSFVGPVQSLQAAFKSIGHFQVEAYGMVRPLIRVSGTHGIPHMTLRAAESMALGHDSFTVNQVRVDLDERHLIVPNIISSHHLDQRAVSLRSFVHQATVGLDITGVKAGDVVVILPMMFPGNTDWVDTPLQRIQGGYVITSMLNSVLTGNWLRTFNYRNLLVALACMAGLLLAVRLRPLAFGVTLALGTVSIVATGIGSFCWFGMIVPWIFPAIGILVSGGVVFANESIENEFKMNNLKSALQGRISKSRIDQIIQDPSSLHVAPAEKVISIMFVDIVGFSQLSERQTPEETFSSLKELFALLRDVVMAFGGVVDKTLGDGLLCYFGYGPDGHDSPFDHADQALACGIGIQEAVLAANLRNAAVGRAIYPLRIGVNTASSYIGNIGDADHYDFTIIGNGVNLAKRLEAACQHYCVNIGASTFDALARRVELESRLTKRLIPIKNLADPVECYEMNPFADRPEDVKRVTAEYRSAMGIERKCERWPVPSHVPILLSSPYGVGQLADFSKSGFAVTLHKYLGAGVQIEFVLQRENQAGHGGLDPIVVLGEVRWGRATESGYLHGILIKNMTEAKKEELVKAFRECVQKVRKVS